MLCLDWHEISFAFSMGKFKDHQAEEGLSKERFIDSSMYLGEKIQFFALNSNIVIV